MKIVDFMKDLYNFTDPVEEHYARTCDVLKAGNPEQELGGKVATAMFPTPEVIRAVQTWGAKLLIVHEPMYYDHWDSIQTLEQQTGLKRQILDRKRKLVEDSGIVVYRWHDHPHYAEADWISKGEVKYFGLTGTWEKGTTFAQNYFNLEKPMTAREMAAVMEKNLGVAHIRIAGAADVPFRRLGLLFGAAGGLENCLSNCDAVLAGETCEWANSEFVRDCSQLGIPKALLVMGHIGSERDGMRLLADVLPDRYSGIEARYFECDEVYTYTDTQR